MRRTRVAWFRRVVILWVFAAQSAGADAPEPEVTRHRDWQVVCAPASGDCAMLQAQMRAGTGHIEVLIELALAEDGAMVGRLRVPLGLHLSAPLRLRVDTRPHWPDAGFAYCQPAACVVPLHLSPAQVAEARRGQVLWVSSQRFPGRDPVVWRFSLLGFTAAQAQLGVHMERERQ